jgi:hypothetical protein
MRRGSSLTLSLIEVAAPSFLSEFRNCKKYDASDGDDAQDYELELRGEDSHFYFRQKPSRESRLSAPFDACVSLDITTMTDAVRRKAA